jgi:hypothetical protein
MVHFRKKKGGWNWELPKPINMTHKERGKGEIKPHIVSAMIVYISRG